ncbi:peptidase M24, structural domain-containing protein [Pisolithus croceorrhizus]|nr:peptidase M24, structural domain-containing protein [Pisolithus croceorrhizus]
MWYRWSSTFSCRAHVYPYRHHLASTLRDSISTKFRSTSSITDMGAIGRQTINTTQRLKGLRELMRKPEFDVKVFVVPSEDEHFSEYPAEADKRRGFISGFNGSAGCAVVTLKDAFLFTDGRYFLQAEQQLDKNWTLMKQGLPDVPTWQEFLSKHLEEGIRIGIDPTLIVANEAESLRKSLRTRDSELVTLTQNPVDIVWGTERPQRPKNKVFVLATEYAGEQFSTKLKRIRGEMAKKNAAATVVTLLDEVAWLLNLRGSDIDFNPVFFAYAIVMRDFAVLFVDKSQLDDSVKTHLGQEVSIRPYEDFLSYLRSLATDSLVKTDEPVLLGDKTNLAVVEALGEENVIIMPSPVAALKAIKNPIEIEGFRRCHIRDGVALARYFAWLEQRLNSGEKVDEYQGAEQLAKFRSELDNFMGLSFTAISSVGPNAAIIHYSPDPNDCTMITKDEIYLCDSGGQYLDGTTDVTRTWHFGVPSDDEKRAFTRVLQGHIAMDAAIFPTGTTGYIVDSFARRPLWEDGLDYRHGTGHGVGHFLNVHEGPQGIGTRIAYNSTALKPGMTVSNEPGYYADGKWGIRIENVVVVREVSTPYNFGGVKYLGFEHVTVCPIQTTLVDLSLLTTNERAWLNNYHREVFLKVAPYLEGSDEVALEWLRRRCAPV